MPDALLGSIWSDLFVPDVSLVEKVLRSLLVFVFLVVALRLGGKRELGQLNILDLAVLLLASNALQNDASCSNTGKSSATRCGARRSRSRSSGQRRLSAASSASTTSS